MTAYNKLFAAIISTLIMRWVIRYFGLDLESIGVSSDLKTAISFGIDAMAAGVTGFFVWLIPNVRKRWNAFSQRWETHTDPPEALP